MYKKVVRAAFLSRRKTFENNIMQTFKIGRERAKELLSACGVQPLARGEQLSPADFARIADKFSSEGIS